MPNSLSSPPDWIAKLPRLGFGCCPMGGHGWGPVDEKDLLQAVGTALDLGVRLFDTSDIYGLGTSETLLGRALHGLQDEAVIATKFGVRHENGKTFNDSSVDWITTAVEGSLRRLKVDCIDLYQMHYWDGKTPIEDISGALLGLIESGKIRAYGITNHNPRDFASSRIQFGPVSYSFHFSLVHREREQDILAIQQENGPIFMSWGSLGQGVLSGKYDSLTQLGANDRRKRGCYQNFHGEKFVLIQRLLDEMQTIALENGIPTLTQLALRWIIDYVPRSIPLVGIKRPEQIVDATGVLNFALEPAICKRLDRLTQHFSNSPTSA